MRALAFTLAFFLFSHPSLAESPADADLPPPPPPPPGARTVLAPDLAPQPEREPEPGPKPQPTPAPIPAPIPAPPATPARAAPASPEVKPISVNLDEVPVSPDPKPTPVDRGDEPDDSALKRWYGWKLIIADGATLSLALAEEPTRVLGQAAFTVASPAIHVGHKRGLAALGSLGLRVGAPLVASQLVRSDDCEGCFPTGWFLGALTAAAVDDSLLAYTSPPEPKEASTLSPGVAVTQRGAAASLAGTF